MLKRTLVGLILLLMVLTPAVNAQEEVDISLLEVSLWPEFDQASILVIYRLTISSQISLPVEIHLRIPASAGMPNAVAAKQPSGGLFNVPYESQQEGEWTVLSFQAAAPELQVEYYDPGLMKDGQKRSFIFHWPGDYPVDALKIEVQQPFDASGMRFAPSFGSGRQAPDGLVYYSYEGGGLTAGQTFEVSIEYQKASDVLTSESMKVEPSGPLDQSASGRQSLMQALPWLLGAIGLLLLFGGGYWYWRSGRQTEAPKRQRVRRHRVGGETEGGVGGEVYCHNCGKRALVGDRFCRACGTQLRIS